MGSIAKWPLLTFVALAFACAAAVPLYPYGEDTGDQRLPEGNDIFSPPVTLTSPFPLCGTNEDAVYVHDNGAVVLIHASMPAVPAPFPFVGELKTVAPFWADVDTRRNGTVWYRQTSDSELLARVRNDILLAFSTEMRFIPLYAFISTWDHVGYFDQHNDSDGKVNTFQCVMTTDGETSFVMFLYANGGIQWTTGDSAGGSRGLGGTPAQVGINCGDEYHYINVPGSRTHEISDISETSNVGVPGMWIFRADVINVPEEYCNYISPESTSCVHGEIQLTNGLTSTEGIVEICVNGTWGTLCDNGFSTPDAVVVCKQLGYRYLGARAVSYTHFGPRYGPVWIENVACTGFESRLLDCLHNGIGNTKCYHYQDVGVICPATTTFEDCSDDEIRLAGGSADNEGTVELCFDKQWGTVCHRSWDILDTRVVCRQLGHSIHGATTYYSSFFGRGTGPIILDDMRCTGTEERLVDCTHPDIGVVYRYCDHGIDVGVRCSVIHNCSDGDVRLVGSKNESEGRVEVCMNKVWGTVCDDHWDGRDGKVVCRQLGYSAFGTEVFSGAYFGEGDGAIWLDDLSCSGMESNLLNCSHRGIGVHGCSHREDAGVRCQEIHSCDGHVRVVNGSNTREGRVEVCIRGEWGTVCGNNWGIADARVVCKQLGYPTLGVQAFSSANFGQGTGLIWFNNVACTGEEPSLLNCSHDETGVQYCNHGQDAGVRCPPILVNITECIDGDIRLVGGSSGIEGRVEICWENQWGTICDNWRYSWWSSYHYWDVSDVRVVCRQLGYSPQGGTPISDASRLFGIGTGPIILDNVQCSSTEERLVDCQHLGIDVHDSECVHSHDVGVRCIEKDECDIEGQIRLVDGSNEREGRVEVCINGEWGAVCDDLWGVPDARVICRQLGYPTLGAGAFSNGHFGVGNGTFVLDDVQCTGEEPVLLNCSHSGTGVYSCSLSEAAGVRCPAAVNISENCTNGVIRLAGGSSESEGRVEICWENQWGTVCDYNWDATDARVACQQLGYDPQYAAIAYWRSHFGGGEGPVILANVQCSGTEDRIVDCPHLGINVVHSFCDHSRDSSITCSVSSSCDMERSVRLVGGRNEREGAVEVCLQGSWGSVCIDGWDIRDSRVVCRQLGYSTLGTLQFVNGQFGQVSVPIVLDDVACDGEEQSLLNCSHRAIGTHNCYDSTDNAGVQCSDLFGDQTNCTNGDIRLVAGDDSMEGRVEICYENLWGTVCDDGWTRVDAAVVCRQLGFSIYGATAHINSQFGRGTLTGPVILSQVACTGVEESLLECTHAGIGVRGSNCDDHGDDAGVSCSALTESVTNCTNGGLRLVGGSSITEGRVEVCWENQWGTVCDENWDASDAQVACQQLGYDSQNAAVAHRGSYFGGGEGLVILANVQCSGTEDRIVDCPHSGINVVHPSCDHRRDSSITCSVSASCNVEGSVRLVDGRNEREGAVEVCLQSSWGSVCRDGWDIKDSRVVCKQLGHSALGSLLFTNGHVTAPIVLDDVACDGEEQSLLNCSHRVIGTPYSYCYSPGGSAGVQCSDLIGKQANCTNGDIRLVAGSVSAEGRVEICYENLWGTVCDDGWSQLDAAVVCQQLGYSIFGTTAHINSHFGGGTGPVILNQVSCTGVEESLLECTHAGIGIRGSNCDDHDEDAGVRCSATTESFITCTNGDLRLVGGSFITEGRVEVCWENQWGTVCDDYWDATDAAVTCRALVYTSYGASAYHNSHFGMGSGPILLDDVQCSGSESELTQCYHRGLGMYSSNCRNHGDDAGVSCMERMSNCSDGSIRLVNGSNEREGRVEICKDGYWGTVCDDSWSNTDAKVVCSQLGYPALGAEAFLGAHFSEGIGPIWMDNVGCTGREETLLQCNHVLGSSCQHSEDAGVQCFSVDNCTDGETRLVDGLSENEGRVEICYGQKWGKICDNDWNAPDVAVVCQQLGYSRWGAVAHLNSHFGGGSGPIVLDRVQCRGTEESLLDCPHAGIGVHYSHCDLRNDAGVTCLVVKSECNESYVRLVNGSTNREGSVEICIDGIWGTVCDTNWDVRDARVVCRQLGHPTLGVEAFHNAYFSQGTTVVWLENLQCTGEEASLINCTRSNVDVSSCGHDNDAGVRCPVPVNSTANCTDLEVRLVGGTNNKEGRVEICYENQWGTVCDGWYYSYWRRSYYWNPTDAGIVCHMLGYSRYGATAYRNSHFGSGSGPIVLDDVQCTGMEEMLVDCPHSGIGVLGSSCDHSRDAGVSCVEVNPCFAEGQIRLLNGTNEREGTVEVCMNGEWGTICHQHWDLMDVIVVCRQLGYPTLEAQVFNNAHFGQGYGVVWHTGFLCSGEESHLVNCSFTTTSSCSHANDAGLRCSDFTNTTNCTNGDIHLVDGSSISESEGRVEICWENQWGTVCDRYWDTTDALVVCRQLGYTSENVTVTAYQSSYFGGGDGPRILNRVQCSGSEERIIDCSHSTIGVYESYCDSTRQAGVTCLASNECEMEGEVRLINGPNEREGRVEVCIQGTWGRTCENYWDILDARVICRQLGFPTIGAQALINSEFGQGSGPVWLDGVNCVGEELGVLNCSHRGIGVHSCYQYQDAGVRCPASPSITSNCTDGDIRLVDGSTEREGRLEFCWENQWGTVCNSYWRAQLTYVACRELGFSTYGATYHHFGAGDGPIMLYNARCTGGEGRLADCTYTHSFGHPYCSHSQDVGVRCSVSSCTDGDIRLVNGVLQSEGRVEICIEGSWGTICDDGWDSTAASVSCKQLGYSCEGAKALTGAYYGQGTGFVWLDDVMCSGDEPTLISCSHATVGTLSTNPCNHREDAGVKCQVSSNVNMTCNEGDVRLLGGSVENEGRVELCHSNQWGRVCAWRYWDRLDAGVVCSQLGYSRYGATAYANSHFGEGSGPVIIDRVNCVGVEGRLLDCQHDGIRVHSTYCGSGYDAGVTCIVKTNCRDGDIRLFSGVTEREGTVEICVDGVWGTVCHSSWDSSDAEVVCWQLGYYITGSEALHNAFFGHGRGPSLLNNVQCSGDEAKLLQCSYSRIGSSPCDHRYDAGVRCPELEHCTDGDVRLRNGDTRMEGRVEICINSLWGTICDNMWSTRDARVVCRQLGYPIEGTQAYTSAYFGQGSVPILLDEVSCAGKEEHLLNCTYYQEAPIEYCSHSEDVGVICSDQGADCADGDVRLAGGSADSEGRIEVCFDNQWGTVCHDSWSEEDVSVVCRQLGYSPYGATAYRSSHYGQGVGPINLDNVRCTGSEQRLEDCPHDGVGVHDRFCNHNVDAGVKCLERTNCTDGELRVTNGANVMEGRVEICIDGIWGTICSDSWDNNDATVVCRQIGYPYTGAEAVLQGGFGYGSGPIFLDDVDCTGNEQDLLSCSHRGIAVENCLHYQDAGVICEDSTAIPPVVHISGEDRAMEFENLYLQCTATGLPLPTVYWLKRSRTEFNVLIISGNRIMISYTEVEANSTSNELPHTIAILTVVNVTTADSGEYICEARNGIPGAPAIDNFVFTVTAKNECALDGGRIPCHNGGLCIDVLGDFYCQCTEDYMGHTCEVHIVREAESHVPTITMSPNNVTVQLVKSLNLTCEATGNPPPSYQWYQDGEPILGATLPYLYITEATPEDRGSYTCVATNRVGQGISDPGFVMIPGVYQYAVTVELQMNASENATVNDLVEELLLSIPGMMLQGTNTTVYSVQALNDGFGEDSATLLITVILSMNETKDGVPQGIRKELVSFQTHLHLRFTATAITRYDGCPSQLEEPLTEGSGFTFNWTESEIGDVLHRPCPRECIKLVADSSEERKIWRRCGGTYRRGAHWEEVDLSQCGLSPIGLQLCEASLLASAVAVAETVRNVTADSDQLGVPAVTVASSVISQLTTAAIEDEEVREDYLQSIDNLLQVNSSVIKDSQRQSNSSSRLLQSLADFSNNVPLPNSSKALKFTQKSYAFRVADINTNSFAGETFSVNLGSVEEVRNRSAVIDEDALQVTKGWEENTGATASVRVPMTTFSGTEEERKIQRLIYTVFLEDTLFQSTDMNQENLTAGSIILAVRSNTTTITSDPSNPLEASFLINELAENASNTICGRWDPQANGGLGAWSTNSCTITSEGDTEGTVRYSQLGHFALLLDLTPSAGEAVSPFALAVITYIGLVISLLCLGAFLITYLSSKTLRKSEHGQILMNLSGSLIGLYIIFLIAGHVAPVPALCGIAAALLQYFMLVYFGWTAAEAIYLYMKLVKVMGTGANIHRYVLKSALVVWLVPLLIVILSVGTGHKYYYKDDKSFCRAEEYPFWIGLIVPFGIIYIFNWVMFTFIMVSICKHTHEMEQNKMTRMRHDITIAIGMATLLGLGWGFGLLATSSDIKELTFTFQIIFSLFVGSQGLLLLVLHGVRSSDARKEWKSWLSKATSKSARLYSVARSSTGVTSSTSSTYGMSALTKGGTLPREASATKSHAESTAGEEKKVDDAKPVPPTPEVEAEPQQCKKSWVQAAMESVKIPGKHTQYDVLKDSKPLNCQQKAALVAIQESPLEDKDGSSNDAANSTNETAKPADILKASESPPPVPQDPKKQSTIQLLKFTLTESGIADKGSEKASPVTRGDADLREATLTETLSTGDELEKNVQ